MLVNKGGRSGEEGGKRMWCYVAVLEIDVEGIEGEERRREREEEEEGGGGGKEVSYVHNCMC